MSFFLIMSPFANSDNHIFSPNTSITHSFTASELQAVKTTSIIWGGTIKTDRYYANSQKFEYNNFEAFCNEIYQKNPNNFFTQLGTYKKSDH